MATDFLSIDDVTNDELTWLLDTGDAYASQRERGPQPLQGRTVAMLFEKPSLRTKVSFDIAAYELGGHAVYLGADEVGLDTREPVEDVARVLERWASVIVARVMAHSTLERFAATASVPVVNALSDVEHPCQAATDLLTIRQRKGRVEGLKVAYIGDANNCALSLGLGALALGADFAIASPDGYAFPDPDANLLRARSTGGALMLTADPYEAADGADVLYTDVWTSMGQEAETARRKTAFQGFQVNERLLARANPGALVMHPMPVHYGEEMEHGMLEHPQSVAYTQAENRLHAQKAVLRLLVAGE